MVNWKMMFLFQGYFQVPCYSYWGVLFIFTTTWGRLPIVTIFFSDGWFNHQLAVPSMEYSRYICHRFKLNVKLGGLRFNPKTLRSLRKNNKMTTWSLENVHISTMDLPRPMPGAPGSFVKGTSGTWRDPQRFKRTFRRCVETCHCNGHIWTKWLKSPCLLWNVSYFGGRCCFFCFFFFGGVVYGWNVFVDLCSTSCGFSFFCGLYSTHVVAGEGSS